MPCLRKSSGFVSREFDFFSYSPIQLRRDFGSVIRISLFMDTHNSPFPATRWTMVQSAKEGNPEQAAQAMEAICRNYWFPIYAYLRRTGRSPEDAEDITQAFFERLIASDSIKAAQQERGKLRTFLLTLLVRLLSDQGRHAKALKRGGGKAVVSLDEMEAEERYAREPQDVQDPEKIYLHAWASDLIQSVNIKLRTGFEEEGRLPMFVTLEPFLSGDDDQPPYDELSAKLGSTPGAVRLLVHRLRKKYRVLLEREIAKTVATPEEVQEELAWLRKVIAE